MNEKTGIEYDDYINNAEKYVCFIKAKNDANKVGIPIDMFILAQFYSMEWRNQIPDPFQLYGDKAIDRARKYCAEKNIKPKTSVNKIDFKKIKAKWQK